MDSDSWSRLIATSGDGEVWLADLDAADAGPDALAVLSEDERERAGRFVFDVHRRRFMACRAWLRARLAARLSRMPGALRFEYGPVGKPSLAGGGLRFNVSHSDRYALLAIVDDAEIGVDIEQLRALRDMDAVAERVFSAAEREVLAGVGPNRKVETFFAGWTRKEAYIKARGEGIGMLQDIEVALAPDDAPRLIRVDGQPAELQRWSIQALSPVSGFAGAVCVEGAGRLWSPM